MTGGETVATATAEATTGAATTGATRRAALAVLELDSPTEALERRFASFVDTHRERAVRLAWRLVGGDAAAAEDVAQDALVRAWRALPRFREEARLETWFYRILVNQAANYRRWRGVRELWRDPGEQEPPDPAPRAPRDPALRRRIGEALERLTRRQREVFVLVHLEGFTVREAAALLRKPEGTLKSHLHRALRSLRTDLADLREPAEGETDER